MSPAGYSLAVLSSNRLRFADCLQWWGSFRLRSTGKTSQPSAGGRRCRRQNRQKCGRFIPALTLRDRNVTPHVSQNLNRQGGSAIDGRTIRHAGYQVSQRKRKRIEEVFGWLKTVGMLRKTRHRGVFKVGWAFTFAAAAYNLVRMRNLTAVLSA